MAKRRRGLRAARRITIAKEDDSKKHRRPNTADNTTALVSTPRHIQLAHAEHFQPSEPARPTLDDRLYALPPELRAHIFEFLLVRPVKWELWHNQDCPLRSHNGDLTPRFDHQNHSCARCDYWANSYWRKNQMMGWMNPWRSQWAPPTLNPYICSDCWDEHFRPRPFPRPVGMRCLCARRDNLEALLVCRRWYEEASRVFWTRNIFAFENSRVFVELVDHLRPQCKDLISKVSIMAYWPSSNDRESTPEEISANWESRKKLRTIWQRLQRLPALSYLELDARFLTQFDCVTRMIRLDLRNVRQINIARSKNWRPQAHLNGSTWIWPEPRYSLLIVGGLAEEVVRAMKGQKRTWMKHTGVLKQEVEGQEDQLRGLDIRKGEDVLRLSNSEFWSLCWWNGNCWLSSNGHASGFLPEETFVPRSLHWRRWKTAGVGFLQNAAVETTDRIV